MNYPIELKKGNVCKVYKSGRWWGGFILSKVYNEDATVRYEVYGGQEHIKVYGIQNEREFIQYIPLNKLNSCIYCIISSRFAYQRTHNVYLEWKLEYQIIEIIPESLLK